MVQGNTDSIVVRFHSWIFIQSKESSDANSELFKEDDDEAMYKNPYEIRLCELISVSLTFNGFVAWRAVERMRGEERSPVTDPG